MPVDNCKTLKDAMIGFKETSTPVTKVKDWGTDFECFTPLKAKNISELMLFNDPIKEVFPKMKFSMDMAPKEVIFAPPATIVYWQDGSRTVVKCSENDEFSEEMGFVLCFMKKMFGNTGKFNNYISEALSGAKRYYPEASSDVPYYIRQIKEDLVKALSGLNLSSSKEEPCEK